MQARATVRVWDSSPSFVVTRTPQQLEQRPKLRGYFQELQKAYKEGRKKEIPQNPFGDTLAPLNKPAASSKSCASTWDSRKMKDVRPAYKWEYINPEHGEVWRYAEATDHMTVWGVEQDGWSIGAQLSTLDFTHAQQEHSKNTAAAVRDPCSGPAMDVEGFRFHFAGSTLRSWTMIKAARELNFVRVTTA
ncbi:hypothetical protein PMIN01_04745 [Paraphaeosphaeria minitans]|uniref:Uncharacterized protein n=1 Tax=Paraphaeosphaeria minitans TaxID=565426 RepID=A0A9P6GKP3_9PLEO|nr:hypothetical protein PMIN01_04745 [Paraphaeosphaeria minitans]